MITIIYLQNDLYIKWRGLVAEYNLVS